MPSLFLVLFLYLESMISSALLEIESAFAVLGFRDRTISFRDMPWLSPSEPRVEANVEPIFLTALVKSG